MIMLVLVLALLSTPMSPTSSVQGGNWQTYQGASFQITYPASFRVFPSQVSAISRDYESVFFAAPDSSVTFYVFSSQWNATPSDIEINALSEVLVSVSITQSGSKVIRNATVRSRDGSYSRSFEVIDDPTTKTRTAFGMSYVDVSSYYHYRAAFLTFKTSLVRQENWEKTDLNSGRSYRRACSLDQGY